MSANSWSEKDAYDELEAVGSLLTDLTESQEQVDPGFHRGLAGRRQKAALALTAMWGGTIALHLVSWGYWLIWALTTVLSIQALRIVLARPKRTPEPLTATDEADYPSVSLLVAAKNEEAVIADLVKALCSFDYPVSRYDLWVIDDNSTDRTPQVLEQLAKTYPQLNVIRRSADAIGGKSGALNEALARAQGDILAVFDADAQVNPEMLRQVLPLFHQERVGAVQLRKAILQAEPGTAHPASRNFWIQGQKAEMALDSYFQQQRIATGGIGELRGNGQFVRRQALEDCGGWNEETITDDLDLTLRLHLKRWDIDFMLAPAVREEGVTRAVSLWHQRKRWAEGGYQRYLDYWRLIARNRMGLGKTWDLVSFWIIQYGLPTASIPDLLLAIARNRPPVLAPLTALSLTLSILAMFVGLRRIQASERSQQLTQAQSAPLFWLTLLETIRGTVYMLHWLPIVALMNTRMAIQRKQLKWVKTVHHGVGSAWADPAEESQKTA